MPRPAAEEATLTKWLGYVKTEARLFASTATKLKAGAEKVAILLTRSANLATDTVLNFEISLLPL